MTRFDTLFYPGFARTVVYMLQASEYNLTDFWAWFGRLHNWQYKRVARRRQLEMTRKAQLLVGAAWAVQILLVFIAVTFAVYGVATGQFLPVIVAIIVFAGGPLYMVVLLSAVLKTGYELIQKPREAQIIAEATQKIRDHKGYKIAIAGSYGKTSCKEILLAVLSQGKKTAATPGNANTPLGISRFVNKLTGDEEVLIFELGEYYPGDIMQLCKMVEPDLGVITGINQAHLVKFGTIKSTIATIFELADFMGDKPVFKNGEDELVLSQVRSDNLLYGKKGCDDWLTSDVKTALTGTTFVATKGDKTIQAHSGLLGLHNVGPLVAAIAIADRQGLSTEQITAGVAATVPFEHRMQPRQLHGAWIIDDTYNGNMDGVKAGLAFLKNCEAKRRIYVTPGLVELGDSSDALHQSIGEQIAGVADVVVLMRNSVTANIQRGLERKQFKGKLTVVDNPVSFYNDLEHFVAAGDVVLMQNDWTDNYN